jgi:hypothetical protein
MIICVGYVIVNIAIGFIGLIGVLFVGVIVSGIMWLLLDLLIKLFYRDDNNTAEKEKAIKAQRLTEGTLSNDNPIFSNPPPKKSESHHYTEESGIEGSQQSRNSTTEFFQWIGFCIVIVLACMAVMWFVNDTKDIPASGSTSQYSIGEVTKQNSQQAPDSHLIGNSKEAQMLKIKAHAKELYNKMIAEGYSINQAQKEANKYVRIHLHFRG